MVFRSSGADSLQTIVEKENRVSVKLSQAILDLLKDEQYALRKTTGREPTYSELVESAWKAYKGSDTATSGGGIEEGLNSRQVKLLRRYADLLRSGRDPEFARIIETMLDRSEVGQGKDQKEESRKAG